jgi:glycosyl transferase family 25
MKPAECKNPHMQIFLINLDRRPDRLAHMCAQLNHHKLSFVRIAAIDGAAYPPAAPGQRLRNSEIACHRSHRVCWKELADSGEPYALILEDDLVLSARFGELLRQPEYFPADADIIRLETNRFGARLAKRHFVTPSGIALHRLFSSQFLAGAYIISAAAAKKLLSNDLSNEIPVDLLLFTFPAPAGDPHRHFIVYQAVPTPSTQMKLCADHRGSSAIAKSDIPHETVSGGVPLDGLTPHAREEAIIEAQNKRDDSACPRAHRSRRPPAAVALVKDILRRPYLLLRGLQDQKVGFDT